ncbi:MAG: PilZ domain-containing protein [Planctomycetes bacterium]|nr:PilZ domain-containing protein [Planctomycetota bacterium]
MDQQPSSQSRTGPRPEVTALIEVPGGPAVRGKVVKVDHHVVSVEFPRQGAPLIPIARQAVVAFSSADLDKPLSARSRVIYRRDEPDLLHYEFQFSAIDGETLNAVFRRRTAARVKPPEVVGVTIRAGYDDTSPGTSSVLNDISLTGLSISLGSQGETMLHDKERLLISFKLPNQDKPIEVIGIVRYRRMAGTMIRYGIEYDPKGTRDYGSQEERIAAYMVKRKIETVQQTLGTRAA